jgi:hypothetical protein
MQPNTPSGFFAALFDLSFKSLITTRIIKVLYVLYMVAIGLFYLIIVIAGFSEGVGNGLAALIVGGVGALLYLIMSRVFLEIVIVLFRLLETNTRIADAVAPQAGGAPPAAGMPAGPTPPAPAASSAPPIPPIPPTNPPAT